MRVSTSGVAGLLLAVSGAVGAAQPPLSDDEPFDFTRALILSFGSARDGWAPLLDTSDPERLLGRTSPTGQGAVDYFFEYLQEYMLRLKRADAGYVRAASYVQPYLTSKDEAIQLGAAAAHKAYTGQITLNEQTALTLKQIADNPTEIELGTLMESGALLQVEREELWRLLLMAATPAATLCLVEVPEDAATVVSQLRITTSERIELTNLLELEFGPSVGDGLQSGLGYIENAARGLHAFLMDPRWLIEH